MRTAILARGIAIVHSDVDYVEDGDEVLILFFGDWATGQAWSKRKIVCDFMQLWDSVI